MVPSSHGPVTRWAVASRVVASASTAMIRGTHCLTKDLVHAARLVGPLYFGSGKVSCGVDVWCSPRRHVARPRRN
jgi:hypothetical protein